MTTQAQNSINLYKGNNPSKIKIGLSLQKPSVVKELMDYFKVDSKDKLALKLSQL